MTEPHDVSDLPAYFDELADMYRDMRVSATTESQRAYYLGRTDALYGAAGMVRGMLGSFDPDGTERDSDEPEPGLGSLVAMEAAGDPRAALPKGYVPSSYVTQRWQSHVVALVSALEVVAMFAAHKPRCVLNSPDRLPHEKCGCGLADAMARLHEPRSALTGDVVPVPGKTMHPVGPIPGVSSGEMCTECGAIDHHTRRCSGSARDVSDPRDEEAAAIERLDGHKHAGDTLVGFAGR